LLDSWNRLNAKGYRNLKDFIQHVQQLRDTLQNHGRRIEDNTAILNVLSAIESVDPSWVHLLEHDYTCSGGVRGSGEEGPDATFNSVMDCLEDISSHGLILLGV
jgi:hypothetical protein